MKKLVAIGDSVVWGQGNSSANKFAARACRMLALDPKPVMAAHSGACIRPNKTLVANYGEVPLDSPGIFDQIPDAVKLAGDVGDVAIVLLNGGINDVPVAKVIFDNDNDLEAQIEKTFTPFPSLLAKTIEAFPLATVVALGYYPIISAETPPKARLAALLNLGPPEIAEAVAAQLEEHGDDTTEVMRPFLTELAGMHEGSALFTDHANTRIRDAVAQHEGRAVFAVPDWRPEYSLGVSGRTLLWLGTNDSIFPKRLARYLAHIFGGKFDWPPTMIVASMGHPNIKGSKAYADAIVDAMKRGASALELT